MNSNSDNPKIGKAFQNAVQEWFEKETGREFHQEEPVAIGLPAKLHKFDIVDAGCHTVIECKCYTWTETGNVPSAKMGFTNEAAFYLSFLPDTVEKVIVMLAATHRKRNESLADYYFRTNRHLLRSTKIMEFDMSAKTMRLVGQNT